MAFDGVSRNPEKKCADAEAQMLRVAFEEQGWEVVPKITATPSDDWHQHIVKSISRCDLFVVFGTDSYGEKTSSKMGTHYEFDQAYQSDVKKTIAHINMTEGARKGLNGIKATFTHENLKRLHQIYREWPWTTKPTPMPDGLMEWLLSDPAARSDDSSTSSGGSALAAGAALG